MSSWDAADAAGLMSDARFSRTRTAFLVAPGCGWLQPPGGGGGMPPPFEAVPFTQR